MKGEKAEGRKEIKSNSVPLVSALKYKVERIHDYAFPSKEAVLKNLII